MQFIGDDFLRLLMLRFVFCYIVLILHRCFKVSGVEYSRALDKRDEKRRIIFLIPF